MKWRELKRRDCEKILEELKEKSTYVEWHGKERIARYGIIAKRVDTDDKRDLRSKGYLVYDLDDVETLLGR